MTMPADPFQAHLKRAQSLFDAGDVVQAGQIWQAILKRNPAHQAARAGLYQVKLVFDRRQATEVNEQLLQEGCTLFDLGQVQDALRAWERILANDPQHQLATAYANDARRSLGLALLPTPAPAAPAEAPADPDQLVLEGSQLYDMGMAEEAVAKWQRALALNPGHPDAPKYLEVARREREAAAAAPPVPAPPAPPSDGQLETRIWRAQQLLRDWRLEEATEAFQRLLDQGGEDARILAGYQQARALLLAQDAPGGPLQVAAEAGAEALPQPVGPPQALTRSTTPPRDGLRLPEAMRGLNRPPWLRSRRNLTLAFGVGLLALLALIGIGVRRREAALREAVAEAKRNALRPVSRMVEIPLLPEPLEAVRREAEGALADDPLLAYFRAQEWQRRDPDDPQAAQLVRQSRDKLAGPPPSASVADFDKAVQTGNLDGARNIILGLLRHDPDDLDLRGRARKVLLALAPLYAGEDHLGKARDTLCLGRAMFPQDLTWQARLKLLEALQAMAKSDRTPWIQLLG
jgi:tetratricopeptide (TPR) repeat protein